jgi:hypothetical protein
MSAIVSAVLLHCDLAVTVNLQLYACLAGFAADMMTSVGAMILMTPAGNAANNTTISSTTCDPAVAGNVSSSGNRGIPSNVPATAAGGGSNGADGTGSSSNFWLVPAADLDNGAAAGLVAVTYQQLGTERQQQQLHQLQG